MNEIEKLRIKIHEEKESMKKGTNRDTQNALIFADV